MTHKTKECLQRPRKQGAKWTGKDIQADEVVQDVDLGWDAKRDRWNGYDAREYDAVVEEYNALEEMKKKVAASKKALTTGQGDDDGADNDNDDEDGQGGKNSNNGEEGARYEEETDMGRRQATSTRNLRLREDTAKYLVNLDLDSAKYDPKTRTMIDDTPADGADAEEGFTRASGDAAEFERAQRYAWEGAEKSGGAQASNIHLQANPTQAQFLRKKELEETTAKKEAQRKILLAKYGGQEHLVRDPLRDSAAVITENERYVEYDERGRVKGEPERKEKSMYREDVFNNNHTSVWGSWWKDFRWGYACCHSTMKASYCTGEEGKRLAEQAERVARGDFGSSEQEETREGQKEIAWRDEAEAGKKQISDAGAETSTTTADREVKKRKLDEIQSGVTEEDMEEYRRKKTAANDPMAALLGKDELVE